MKSGTSENIHLWCSNGKSILEKPNNADFTVDKAQPSYHWCHIWLLLLLFILIWTESSDPILSCSSELYRETHKKVKRAEYMSERSNKKSKKNLTKNIQQWQTGAEKDTQGKKREVLGCEREEGKWSEAWSIRKTPCAICKKGKEKQKTKTATHTWGEKETHSMVANTHEMVLAWVFRIQKEMWRFLSSCRHWRTS